MRDSLEAPELSRREKEQFSLFQAPRFIPLNGE
jgi:hypothetical protein